MKHKHYDCIVAWADGAQIQARPNGSTVWADFCNPQWDANHSEYRIKPKPDIYKYVDVRAVRDGICQWTTCLPEEANLGLIFDGETKRLKTAEVMK
jgi:hypothetical protein